MDNISGISVRSSLIATGYFVDGSFSNERKVRQISLTGSLPSGVAAETTVYSTFSGTGGLITGVAYNSSGEVWSTLLNPNSDGYNLYRYSAAGTLVDRHKVSASNTVLNDVAVDGSLVYMACPSPHQSVIRFDVNNPGNTQLLFTGASAINPAGVALDTSGNVYVSDVMTGKIIKYAKSNAERLLEFDGKGKNGSGQAFTAIGDLAVDPRNGDIYVIAVAGGSPKIFRYTNEGNFVSSFGHSDMTDPDKMAIGSNGHIYVTDGVKKGILAFDAGN
jgi:hypothetical protein